MNDYELFKYPDYTLAVYRCGWRRFRGHRLDILHVHYAVPHATAAILARLDAASGTAAVRRHDAARHRHDSTWEDPVIDRLFSMRSNVPMRSRLFRHISPETAEACSDSLGPWK